jgi:hypothetical protein
MNREELMGLMEKRGFLLHSTIRLNDLNGLLYKFSGDFGIFCDVRHDSSFLFTYITEGIEIGLLTLTSGPLSPVDDDAHFRKWYQKFITATLRLQ